MVGGRRIRQRFIAGVVLLCAIGGGQWVQADGLPAIYPAPPDTECGNVILRPLDNINIPPFPPVLGHVGIYGRFEGDDNANEWHHFIYDIQPKYPSDTSACIVVKRTYY